MASVMPKLGSVDDLRVFYLRRATDDQRAAVRTGSLSLGCATLAKAQALMDAVCRQLGAIFPPWEVKPAPM